MGGRAGIARSGAIRSSDPVRWHIYVDGNRLDPIILGRIVLDRWTAFLKHTEYRFEEIAARAWLEVDAFRKAQAAGLKA